MARIQINQTLGAIQIESRPAQLRVFKSQRTELDMKQNKAEMNVDRQPARLEIDQSECFASSGLKTPVRLAIDFYRGALSAGMEAIASIAQEGLRFLRIEQGGNPFAEIARTRGVHLRQAVMVTMPAERPRINFEPAKLNISWKPHSVEAYWNRVDREVEYVPWEVIVGMKEYPAIDISVAEDAAQS